MLKTSTLIVVIGLIAAGAVVNGAAMQRWSTFAPDSDRTEALHASAIQFGDWHAVEVPTEMPTNERSIATSRCYTSASTGRSGIVTLISGVPGSVSAHTPDVCYPGSGYQTLQAPKRVALELPGGRSGVCYVADFEKKTATKHDRVRVRWAFTTDGTWVAPENPRWQFARQIMAAPELYKVYIATPLADSTTDQQPPEDDPATRAFISAVWVHFSAAFEK